MRVCIVARGIPSKQYRMNGIFEYDQAKVLARSGVKVIYIALDLRSFRRRRYWGIHRTEANNMVIYNVNIPIGAIPNNMLCFIGKHALVCAFKRIIRAEGRPDIIHAHFVQYAYMASFLKERYKIPLVVTEHSADVNQTHIRRSIYKIAQKAYRKADSVIAVSQPLEQQIFEKFGVKSCVISNIINFDCFQYTDRKTGDSFQFISVGGLVPDKGMDILIDGFYDAFGVRATERLVIFGEGSERVRLEEKIQNYGLENQICLMGLRDRNDIYTEMKKSNCFVLASMSETFGMAYVEALATGIPVIATKCGGPEEFVNESNGIIVSVGDASQISSALKKMRHSAEAYDGTAIAKEIRNKYSGERIVMQIMDIYEQLR